MTIKRRPACPSCEEPGIRVKGDYFRCSNTDCNAVWQQRGWDKMIEEEKVRLAESERLIGVHSLLAIQELRCDKCGKIIEYGDRYCLDSNELVDDLEDTYHPFKRGKRTCKKCSLRAGFLRMVYNRTTGETFAAMLLAHDEHYID